MSILFKHLSPLFRESFLLMRVDRPVGTWLLMWPSLWALLAASKGWPEIKLWAIFIMGAFIMRSAGCVVNDMADRSFDPHVERTKSRPLARGAISLHHAGILLFILLILALLLALQLNQTALWYCIPGAFLALTYPLTKRYIHLPQLYMGAAFGWGVVIAWASVAGEVSVPAWLFFFSTLFWAAGYDTIYGMIDREDDVKIGVKSTAILFGSWVRFWILFFYVLTLLCWSFIGFYLEFGHAYFLFILLAFLHMLHQVHVIKHLSGMEFLPVFASNKHVGLLIFLGILSEKIIG